MYWIIGRCQICVGGATCSTGGAGGAGAGGAGAGGAASTTGGGGGAGVGSGSTGGGGGGGRVSGSGAGGGGGVGSAAGGEGGGVDFSCEDGESFFPLTSSIIRVLFSKFIITLKINHKKFKNCIF